MLDFQRATSGVSSTIAGLGARADFIATTPGLDPAQQLALSQEERAVLRLIGRARRIDEVLAHCGLEEAHAIRLLLALRTKGLIVPVRGGPSAPGPSRSEPPRSEPTPLSADRRGERQARLARHPYMMRTHQVAEHLARGKAALARNDFDRAYADLNQVLSVEPKNREAATLLAEARRRHDEERARKEFQRGQELERQQDLSGALEAYRRACSLDSHQADAAFQAARVARTLGVDWNEVRTHAQRAVDLAPGLVPNRLLLAQVLMEGDAGKLAKHHLEAVLRLEPGNEEARLLLRKMRWPF